MGDLLLTLALTLNALANLSVAYPVMTAGGILIVVSASFVFLKEPVALVRHPGSSPHPRG
jgi:multidrug transporter EmrE-like cation transporter